MSKMFSMDDYFSINFARKEFINKLKAKGYSKDMIEEMVKIADEMYEKDKIPYPDNF